MARQIEGINGGFCGRVGTVIGYEWRGKWCMRSYPRHIHDAKSPQQLRQREWFKLAVGLAGQMKGLLRVGMRERSRRLHMTEGNYFVSLNKECFNVDEGRLRVDYAHLTVSDGTVAPVGFGTPTLEVTARAFKVSVDFSENPLGLPVSGEDEVYVAAMCEEEGTWVMASPAFRREEHAEMRLPACWEGKNVHLYGFARDYTGETSLSQYLGSMRVEEESETVETNPRLESSIAGVYTLPHPSQRRTVEAGYSMAAAISAARDCSSSGVIST